MALLAGTFVLAVSASPAFAHPLGNFTINHLTKISVMKDRVALRYVLDMAEIPTYSTLRAASPTGTLPKPQLESWGRTEAASLLPEVLLSGDGRAIPLRLDRVTTRTRPGAGGLPTLYLVIDAHASLARPIATMTYRDETFPGRLGWHDVVVAPRTEPTQELSAYPSALIGSPRATTAVSLVLRDGIVASVRTDDAADESGAAAAVPSAVRSNQLSDMLARGTSDWGFVALTFLVAIVLGGLHALEPGHGKTLLAVSLVGARATVKQAAILAAALTVAHTIGVLALGVAINIFKGYFVPEAIYPWITLASGIVIAVIGARAVQRQILLRQPLAHGHAHEHAQAHPHEHEHVHSTRFEHPDRADGHTHASHSHPHDEDDIAHARSHAIPGNAPLTFGGTVWAAMSGGVAPCPAALVVLLAALALNQVAYGIFVIVAFSFGLAITLTGLGIAVVRSASWLQGRPQFERFVIYGPLVSAVVISSIGSIMVGQGFAQQGVSISPLAITAIVALAIVGYAFSHPFSHRHAEAA
jgi:nickel/cobalt exporter